jgi:hypothetical protein
MRHTQQKIAEVELALEAMIRYAGRWIEKTPISKVKTNLTSGLILPVSWATTGPTPLYCAVSRP